MKFINVSSHKDQIIINTHVYFSQKLYNFLSKKKSENPNIIYAAIGAIPLGVWAQKIEDYVAQVIIFFVEYGIPKTDEIRCFSAEFNNETCILCIEEDELLLFNSMIKKGKKSLKSFFDEGQAREILREFEENIQARRN